MHFNLAAGVNFFVIFFDVSESRGLSYYLQGCIVCLNLFGPRLCYIGLSTAAVITIRQTTIHL